MEAGPRFKARAEIQSLASRTTLRRAARSLRPDEIPSHHALDWSLNGRENVVPKNGPFSMVFSQIAALMLPHHSWFAGWLLAAIVCPPWLKCGGLSRRKRRVHAPFIEEARRRRQPANRRGARGGSDRRTGAGADYEEYGHMKTWMIRVLMRCLRALRQLLFWVHRRPRHRRPPTRAHTSPPRRVFAQPKPKWVQQDIIRLKALMPQAGCRTIAHHFNRR
jgi:hypothetical protein